jgi:hypothetical protein
MGRNKDLRKKIAGWENTIAEHEDKIRRELTKEYPNEEYIQGWRREIEGHREKVARLTRRLKREL